MEGLKKILDDYFPNTENYFEKFNKAVKLIFDLYEYLGIDNDEYHTLNELEIKLNSKAKNKINFDKEKRTSNNLQNEIRKIEDKYDLLTFRMAVTYLIDIGHRNLLNTDNIENIFKEIEYNDMFSYEYQCKIVKCAKELTQYSILSLIKYIKANFYLDFKDKTI